jgi:hypothetical protein
VYYCCITTGSGICSLSHRLSTPLQRLLQRCVWPAVSQCLGCAMAATMWIGVVWHTAVGRHECAVREGQLLSGHSPELDFGGISSRNLGSHTMKIEHENRTFVTLKSASPGSETRAERNGLVYGYDTAFGELVVFTSYRGSCALTPASRSGVRTGWIFVNP